MRRIAVLFLVVVVATTGWLVWDQQRPQPFVLSGFMEADEIRVGSRVGGRVSRVAVEEGASTEPGDLLFELEPFDLRDALTQAQGALAAAAAEHARLAAGFRPEEIEQARARRDHAAAVLDRLIAGPRVQEIAIAREQVNEAKAMLEWAQHEHDRLKALREEDAAADTEFRQQVRILKTSQASLAGAEQKLDLLEAGTRSEEIAEARAALAEADQALKLSQAGFREEDVQAAAARVTAARAEVSSIETRLTELSVRSPCRCRVEAISLRPGDLASPNAPMVALLDTSRLWVRAYVPEDRLGRVRIGTIVPVRVDSFPEERFRGTVTFVASEAEFTPQNVQTPDERSQQVFRIKVTMTEGVERLRVGMWADVLLDEAAAP